MCAIHGQQWREASRSVVERSISKHHCEKHLARTHGTNDEANEEANEETNDARCIELRNVIR